MRVLRTILAAALVFALAVPAGASAKSSPAQGGKADVSPTSRFEPPNRPEPRKRPQPETARFARPTFAPKAKAAGGAAAGNTVVIGVEAGQAASVANRLRAAGWSITRTSRNGERLLAVPPATGQATAMGAAEAVGGVTYAEPSRRMRVMGTIDPAFDSQWGLQKIGALSAWNVTSGSAEVTIAVIDTGVDLSHADLASHVDTSNDFDFVNQDATARDDMGHGTHVAGIAAALANAIDGRGLAPEATILPIKALDSWGGGSDFDIADAIEYAADKDASIVNMSFGDYYASQPIVDAVAYARSKGVVLVAAAGNEGAGEILYPAALPGVIAVGASTPADTAAQFSGSGPELDLMAPGTAIVSTKMGGGTMQASGTSMASPFVAGAAALLLAENPAWTAEQVEDRLKSTAHDLGRTGTDIDFGAGRLNAANALGQPGGDGSEVLPLSDDDIPGLEATSSPKTGTLDEELDQLDVRRIHLSAGQRLSASLTGPAGTDFDVYLFSPDAESAYSAYPIEVADGITYPDRLAYTAPRDGDFYLAVAAIGGKGSYTLSWTIGTPAPSDDVLPGLPLPASPAKGSLFWFDDDQDLCRVHLEKGQRFAMRLNASAGFVYTAEVFGPDTWSLDEPEFGPGTGGGIYYEREMEESGPGSGIAFTAEKTGDHYIALRTPFYGMDWEDEESFDEGFFDFLMDESIVPFGTYTCQWSIIDPLPDDEIPGIEMTTTPIADSIDNPMDRHDVRRIHLDEGQRLNVQLTTTKPARAGLVLYSDVSTSTVSGRPLAGSFGGDYASAFSYVASASRDYYVDVEGWNGAGPYQLKWSVNDAVEPEFSVTPPSTAPAYGAPTSVSVMATDTLSSTPATDLAVELEQWTEEYGMGFWIPVSTRATDADGRATLRTALTYKQTYRIASYQGSEVLGASDTFTIKPKASLGKPGTATTVRAGRSALFAGQLKPRHTAGKSSADILCYRKSSSGNWVFKKRVRTQNYNWYSFTQYRARFTLSSGTWKLVADAPEDLGHVHTVSDARIVTVR